MTLENGQTVQPIWAVVRGAIDEPGHEWIDTSTCACTTEDALREYYQHITDCPNNPCHQSMPMLRLAAFVMTEVRP